MVGWWLCFLKKYIYAIKTWVLTLVPLPFLEKKPRLREVVFYRGTGPKSRFRGEERKRNLLNLFSFREMER